MDETIAAVQQDISAISNAFYAEAYGPAELNYWQHVPGWIKAQRRGCTVLDIGAAYGTLALFARRAINAEVTCIDTIEHFHPKQLFADELIEFTQKNIETDSLSGKFDVIIFTEVLEHLNFHPVPTLKKIHALMDENSVMFLTTPDALEWGRVTKYYPSLESIPLPQACQAWIDDHVWQYSEDELLGVLDEADFRVETLKYSPGDGRRHFNMVIKIRG